MHLISEGLRHQTFLVLESDNMSVTCICTFLNDIGTFVKIFLRYISIKTNWREFIYLSALYTSTQIKGMSFFKHPEWLEASRLLLSSYLRPIWEWLCRVFICKYTPLQRSWWGYIGFTPPVCLSVRLSVHPFVHPASRFRSVTPTVLAGSISYLYILFSNFRRCVAPKFSCKIVTIKFLAIF